MASRSYMKKKIVISASRRQDIPAHRLERLLDQVERGRLTWIQPYSGRSMSIDLSDVDVLSIVLWSKDFGPLLSSDRAAELLDPLNPYFIFTINHCPELEPGLKTPLRKRLEQAEEICSRYGPKRLLWRFDPIVHWVDREGTSRNNIGTFFDMVPRMAEMGVTRCTFSFAQIYGKVLKREKRIGIKFIDPPVENKVSILKKMADFASEFNIVMQTCCQPELEGVHVNVVRGSCIDGHYLAGIFDVDPSLVDLRQHPSRQGCGCTKSMDIGSYEPCPHSCLYCYANPA